MSPPRPALRYYEGKFRLAAWIISYFPEHLCYVEPFGGAASVLLSKAPSQREVYNDADAQVVNFFRILRERQEDFVRAIRLTPYSRLEAQLAYEPTNDPLEAARRLYIQCWQTITSVRNGGSCSWRFERSAKRGKSAIRDWTETDHLPEIVERLRGVQIENDDAFRVIPRFDAPTTLFYCDPPYPGSVRSARGRREGYRHDMDEEAHRELAKLLHTIRGMAIVSTYPSDLYRELYADWEMASHRSGINSMHAGTAVKIECLLISPRASRAAKQKRMDLEDP